MPELPEVETVVRDLRPLLVGRSFVRIDVSKKALRRKWSRRWEAELLGQRVGAIHRRGKWIQIELTDGPLTPGPSPPEGRGEKWLLVHLGMTGQFTVVADVPRENHTHLVFTLDDACELRFRDVRRFGSVTLVPTRTQLDQHFLDIRLGPEPFDVDPAYWRDALRSTRRNLKAILLDQTVIAGVGNIYADESLFEARLHPTLLGPTITAKQAEGLRRAVATVLTRAIEQRGSSIRDYIGGSGLKGNFQDEFHVYGRTGERCLRCRASVEKMTLAGRSTHYCPKCQRKRA